MEWDAAETIAETIGHVFETVAIIIGGLWAYFRFDRFRTLKPRLTFSFDWTRSDIDECRSLIVLTLKLCNKGHTKVELRKDEDPRCFLKFALIRGVGCGIDAPLVNLTSRHLKHLDVVFAPHRWIEPAETIDDVKVLEIYRAGALAIQTEVLVFGAKKYSAPSALSLVGVPTSVETTSEDEQDDYDEIELIVEGLKSVLARLMRVGNAPIELAVDFTKKIEVCVDRLERLDRERLGEDSTRKFVGEAANLWRSAERFLRSHGTSAPDETS